MTRPYYRIQPWLLLAAVMLLSTLAGCQDDRQPAVTRGSSLPALALKDLAGNGVHFPAAYRGKVLAILFWTRGCSFCKREMPTIEPLYKKYAPEGFVFAAVHVGKDDGTAKAMARSMGLTFPMLIDAKSDVRKAYGVSGVPSMCIVDRDGLLAEKILGGLSAVNLERIIKEHL